MAQENFKIEDGMLLAYAGKDTTVTVPDGVTEIGVGAFYENKSITCVRLPDSVTSIGRRAFHGCRSLTSVSLPHHSIQVAENAFHGTPFCPVSNEGMWGYEKPGYVDGHLVVGPRVILRKFTVKEGTEFIDEKVFSEIEDLPNVHLPEGLLEIGEGAVVSCRALTEVTLPSTLVKIGKDAFKGCTSLKKINLPSALAESDESALADCRVWGGLRIPEGATVCEGAFAGAGAPLGECRFDEAMNLPFAEIPEEKKTYRLFTVKGEDTMDGVFLGLDRFTVTPCNKAMWDTLMDACNEWEIHYEHVDDFDPGDECGYAEPSRTIWNERYNVYPENCLVRNGKVIGFAVKDVRLILNKMPYVTVHFPTDDSRETSYETYSLKRRKV